MTERLRFKMLLLFLPLLVLTVIVSGTLAFLEYQSVLLRSVNHHLSYKAEQLRDYMYSEWGIVEDLKLANQDAYRHALEKSFRSYAYSLLRDDTELVLALDAAGHVIASIDLKAIDRPLPETTRVELPAAGWFSAALDGRDIVGVSFAFTPFRWTVALTQTRAAFLAGVDNILFIHLWILFGALTIGTALTTFYVGRVVKPLETLSATLDEITLNEDLSRRVAVQSGDEIGLLSHRFNLMIASLEQRVHELVVSEQAERAANETASQREQETLFLLGKISDFRDESTGHHLTRIGAMSGLLARLAGLDEHAQKRIRLGSPLHDLGKIVIPDTILLKTGVLTKTEVTVMRRHTTAGYELLKDSESQYLVEGAIIALNHHEKWDGSGYPNGIKGEEIPISARIVAIVDVFDALVSERPYKRAWSYEEALAYMVDQRGKHFDPELLDRFVRHFDVFVQTRENWERELALRELGGRPDTRTPSAPDR